MLEVLAPIALIVIVVAGSVGVFWMFRSFRRKNEKMRDAPAGQVLAELAHQRGWNYEPENTGFADHVTDHPVYGGAGKKIVGHSRPRQMCRSDLLVTRRRRSVAVEHGHHQRVIRISHRPLCR